MTTPAIETGRIYPCAGTAVAPNLHGIIYRGWGMDAGVFPSTRPALRTAGLVGVLSRHQERGLLYVVVPTNQPLL